MRTKLSEFGSQWAAEKLYVPWAYHDNILNESWLTAFQSMTHAAQIDFLRLMTDDELKAVYKHPNPALRTELIYRMPHETEILLHYCKDLSNTSIVIALAQTMNPDVLEELEEVNTELIRFLLAQN